MLNLIKELISLWMFYVKTPKEQKELVFYAEHDGYYPNYEGLINELTTAGIYLCYITSDLNDKIFTNDNQHIHKFYVNKFLPFFMGVVNCKVFVMTLTELDVFHLKRSINPVHYIYLFHSMVSTHMMYSAKAFDNYDEIFCVGPYHIEEIRKREAMYGLPAKKLQETGYYRLERIYKGFKEFSGKLPVINTKTILIAPSWGDDNLLKSCGEQLIELLIQANYRVIVRPHPEIMRRDPSLIRGFEIKFAGHDNFILEKTVFSDQSLFEADVLITDCSGVAIEYAFGTERPVIFIDVPIKINNPNYGELGIMPLELSLRDKIGIIIERERINEINLIVQSLLLKKESYLNIIRELRGEVVYSFGASTKISVEDVKKAILLKH
ncbi:MAG: CDP-glycerol glycerophosphotransferase family protein [bacterium]